MKFRKTVLENIAALALLALFVHSCKLSPDESIKDETRRDYSASALILPHLPLHPPLSAATLPAAAATTTTELLPARLIYRDRLVGSYSLTTSRVLTADTATRKTRRFFGVSDSEGLAGARPSPNNPLRARVSADLLSTPPRLLHSPYAVFDSVPLHLLHPSIMSLLSDERMSDVPPMPAANAPLSARPLPAHQHALELFVDQATVKQEYATAIAAYIAMMKDYHRYAASMEKFEAACRSKQQFSRLSLPKGLALNIASRAAFVEVKDQPLFYKEDIARLEEIEQTASTAIIDTMHKAKSKHLEHIRSLCNRVSFVERTTASYASFVQDYLAMIAKVDPTAHPAGNPDTIQLQEAVTHFRVTLGDAINTHLMQQAFAAQRQKQHELERQRASEVAQEQIHTGMSTGATITALAKRATSAMIAPLVRKVDHLAAKGSSNKSKQHQKKRSHADGPGTTKDHDGTTRDLPIVPPVYSFATDFASTAAPSSAAAATTTFATPGIAMPKNYS